MALRKAANALDRQGALSKIGKGRCAHCKRLQGWMTSSALQEGVTVFFEGCLVNAVVCFFAWFGLNDLMGVQQATAAVVVGTIGAVGAVASLVSGVIAGPRLATSTAPHEESDRRTKTDEELLAWIEDCNRTGIEPFIAWWTMVERSPQPREHAFSIGLLDKAEPLLEAVDESLRWPARSAALNRL